MQHRLPYVDVVFFSEHLRPIVHVAVSLPNAFRFVVAAIKNLPDISVLHTVLILESGSALFFSSWFIFLSIHAFFKT